MFEDAKLGAKIKEKNATIISGSLPVIQGNREMLEYLFFHLLGNAIKFNDAGNEPVIKINAEIIEESHSANQETVKRFHRIVFTDNGIGFSEQETQQIFRVFNKLQPDRFRGSGIGLAICQKIMEAHNGFIKVETREGAGSSFACYFPIERLV